MRSSRRVTSSTSARGGLFKQPQASLVVLLVFLQARLHLLEGVSGGSQGDHHQPKLLGLLLAHLLQGVFILAPTIHGDLRE